MHKVTSNYKYNTQKLSSYVTGMLHKVSSVVNNMLSDLQEIYLSHGIKFSVKHQHLNLMRMCSPLQLSSYLGDGNQLRIVSEEVLRGFEIGRDLKRDREKGRERQRERERQVKREMKEKNLGQNSTSCWPVKRQHFDDEALKKRLKQLRHPPILGQEGQKQLCRWAYGVIRKGDRRIMLKDIGNQAKVIGKDLPRFVANLSWVRKFLRRFPDLEREYESAKLAWITNQRKQPRRAKYNQQSDSQSYLSNYSRHKDFNFYYEEQEQNENSKKIEQHIKKALHMSIGAAQWQSGEVQNNHDENEQGKEEIDEDSVQSIDDGEFHSEQRVKIYYDETLGNHSKQDFANNLNVQ